MKPTTYSRAQCLGGVSFPPRLYALFDSLVVCVLLSIILALTPPTFTARCRLVPSSPFHAARRREREGAEEEQSVWRLGLAVRNVLDWIGLGWIGRRTRPRYRVPRLPRVRTDIPSYPPPHLFFSFILLDSSYVANLATTSAMSRSPKPAFRPRRTRHG